MKNKFKYLGIALFIVVIMYPLCSLKAENQKEFILLGGSTFNGFGNPTSYLNDVWNSDDGINWSLVSENSNTTTTKWSQRSTFTSLAFKHKIWVMGGENSSGYLNDVWASNDNGSNWIKITNNAPWQGRRYASSVVLDGKMYIIGGYGNVDGMITPLRDVWSTKNGTAWKLVTDQAPWDQNTSSDTASIFNNKIWVVDGYNIYSSEDGKNWTTSALPETYVTYPSLINKGNDLYLTGSSNGKQQIWKSSDGLNWVSLNQNVPWSLSVDQNETVRWLSIEKGLGKLWIFGGLLFTGTNSPENMNDVWSSKDGITWNQETIQTQWSSRYGHSIIRLRDIQD